MPIDEQVHPTAQPVLPVEYFKQTSYPIALLVRTIGLLAVVLGAIDLAMFPFSLAYSRQQQASLPAGVVTTYWSFNRMLGLLVSFVLAGWLAGGGLGCLCKWRAARSALLGWGWAKVVWACYGVAMNGWYILPDSSALYTRGVRILSFGNSVQRWLATLVLPLIIIVLFRQRAVASVMQPDAAPVE